MEKKIRKITLEWESAEPPEWLENLVVDNRCLSFSVKEGVTEKEWHELIEEKMKWYMNEYDYLKNFPKKALEFATASIEGAYYIE